MKLLDGTVIPSSFRAKSFDSGHGAYGVGKQNNLKIGTIIAVRYIDSTEGLQESKMNTSEGDSGIAYETVYDVKVDDMLYRPFIVNGCRMIQPFFGPNNYFEVIHESTASGTGFIEKTMFQQAAESLAGARCVLLFLEGESGAPVILGFLTHPSRKSKITKDKEIQMGFEFNGFGATIDKDGAFTLTAAGPFVPAINVPIGPIVETGIRVDPVNGPLTIAIDKQFNFTLTDIAGQIISVTHDSLVSGIIALDNGSDSIKISKAAAGGTIAIISSKTFSEACMEYTLDASTTAAITTKTLTIAADVSTEITTKNFKLQADIGAEINGAQVKIAAQTTFALECATMKLKGATGELLAILDEIFTGLGGCTVASPVGPCAPLQGAPQWAASVAAALIKLKGLMG